MEIFVFFKPYGFVSDPLRAQSANTQASTHFFFFFSSVFSSKLKDKSILNVSYLLHKTL